MWKWKVIKKNKLKESVVKMNFHSSKNNGGNNIPNRMLRRASTSTLNPLEEIQNEIR